jgi:hypothetical protein
VNTGLATAAGRHAQGTHDAVAADLVSPGGILRCGECGTEDPLSAYGIAAYLRDGWPVCCGYAMTWVTQRELDEGKK